jgi:hypothetical protein
MTKIHQARMKGHPYLLTVDKASAMKGAHIRKTVFSKAGQLPTNFERPVTDTIAVDDLMARKTGLQGQVGWNSTSNPNGLCVHWFSP